MRRRGNGGIRCLHVLLAALPLAVSCASVAAAELTSQPAVEETAVRAAVDRLGEDPNLSSTREVRRLHWIDETEEEKEDQERPRWAGWTDWIGNLFGWFAEVSRVFVWLLIVSLIALFVLYLVRLGKSFESGGERGAAAAPTHVRDLDIRPESLPDDIGAAAWTLWERAEHREAMALLYRGVLSRLVHDHEVPIRHSSTEGDSLALAERHLPRERLGYVAGLIRTWQRAVYGGKDPLGAEMRLLCEQFAAALVPATVEPGARA